MPAAPAVEARTSAALAALAAAGGDADALGEAVEGAAWLDAVPGDGRQALRGAAGGGGGRVVWWGEGEG